MLSPVAPSRRRAYALVTGSSAPVFLAMIVAPRSSLTARLVGRSGLLHAALGAGYGGLLVTGVATTRSMPDLRDPDRLRAALAHQDFFLAGWTHYVTFDLFVGQWIWRDALEAGRSARLALFLTWMVGPIGLAVYLAQRRLSPGRRPTGVRGGRV